MLAEIDDYIFLGGLFWDSEKNSNKVLEVVLSIFFSSAF